MDCIKQYFLTLFRLFFGSALWQIARYCLNLEELPTELCWTIAVSGLCLWFYAVFTLVDKLLYTQEEENGDDR